MDYGILTFNMGIRKARGYQDIEGVSGAELPDPDFSVPQEIEMASVSVVPDGIGLFVYVNMV